MAVDCTTLGGAIHTVFCMTGCGVLVELCNAAGLCGWAGAMNFTCVISFILTNFLLSLLADEETGI